MSEGEVQNLPDHSVDRSLENRRRFRRRLVLAGVLLVVLTTYVGSYAVLSSWGEYRARPSGKYRWGGGRGMAFFELSVWIPYGVYWERRIDVSGKPVINANRAGWLYLPLLSLDRQYVHRTVDVFETEEGRKMFLPLFTPKLREKVDQRPNH